MILIISLIFQKMVGLELCWPKQHFAHSIFRSIESGKYIIRSANNGISAIINPMGIIEQKIEFGSTGYVDFKKESCLNQLLLCYMGIKSF